MSSSCREAATYHASATVVQCLTFPPIPAALTRRAALPSNARCNSSAISSISGKDLSKPPTHAVSSRLAATCAISMVLEIALSGVKRKSAHAPIGRACRLSSNCVRLKPRASAQTTRSDHLMQGERCEYATHKRLYVVGSQCAYQELQSGVACDNQRLHGRRYARVERGPTGNIEFRE